ncbi:MULTISPECIES: carbohydrate porin [Pseudomonas]|uniref:Porin n=1 Tax=Pseudomonas gingeri TaxID=117681 RepID=A0A7Y7WXT3_9PSED|nr:MULTISPECIES: carbohydrate porin [Pseudomonas]MPQ68428.1 porin [Pseudomonas sp. MWU12-2323]NWB88497.1 porin [Pseudomonas gingeri]
MKNFAKCTVAVSFCLLIPGFACAADEAFAQDSRWMTGDWGGQRSKWLDQGVDIELGYTGEMAANVHGGYDKNVTARWTEQYAVGFKADLQKILDWENTQFQFTVTERDGRNLTNDRVADPRVGAYSSSQEVYGRGQTWRLTQMWMSKAWLDGALDIKAGRFDEGSDFNSFPCDFQSTPFCGAQAANWIGDIWYNWPVSQWALRTRYQFTPEVYAQIGVFEQNPSYLESDNGFKLSGSGTKGAVIPIEVVWSPKVNGLAGEYRLGYYKSTAKADDVLDDVNGNPQPLSGDAFQQHSSRHGYWLVAQQQLTARDGDSRRGLSVFANLTAHDKATSRVDHFIQAGIVYKGVFDSRPLDDLGVGIAEVHTNPAYRERAQLQNQQNGISDYDNPGYLPVQYNEISSEIYYGVHVSNWLTVRPNLQYVKNPGGVREIDAALIAGLKVQAKF